MIVSINLRYFTSYIWFCRLTCSIKWCTFRPQQCKHCPNRCVIATRENFIPCILWWHLKIDVIMARRRSVVWKFIYTNWLHLIRLALCSDTQNWLTLLVNLVHSGYLANEVVKQIFHLYGDNCGRLHNVVVSDHSASSITYSTTNRLCSASLTNATMESNKGMQTSVSAAVRSCLAISFVIWGFKLALNLANDCCLKAKPLKLDLTVLKPLTTAVKDVNTRMRANKVVESIMFPTRFVMTKWCQQL